MFLCFGECYIMGACRNSFFVFVTNRSKLKIGSRFFFVKVVAVNKNRLFLPFLSSDWIPLQVLPDWKMGTMVASFSVWNCRRCRRHGRCCRRHWQCRRTPSEVFLLSDLLLSSMQCHWRWHQHCYSCCLSPLPFPSPSPFPSQLLFQLSPF